MLSVNDSPPLLLSHRQSDILFGEVVLPEQVVREVEVRSVLQDERFLLGRTLANNDDSDSEKVG